MGCSHVQIYLQSSLGFRPSPPEISMSTNDGICELHASAEFPCEAVTVLSYLLDPSQDLGGVRQIDNVDEVRPLCILVVGIVTAV